MKYINTIDYFSKKRNIQEYSIEEVLLTGQAPSKGLYVPKEFAKYPPSLIKSFKDKSYSEIAYHILYPYFDDIPKDDFETIISSVYGDIKAPIKELYPNHYILELFNNWTFAFKDFAAQLLAALIEYYLKKSGKKIIIFVGTSGDTGPAIDEAFWKKENIKVYCLFPKNGVTEIQRKQMTTLGENIYPIEVDGDFHTCQEMAKSALDDPSLKKFNPTSANSINWGRFIPQSVFAFWLYSNIAEYDEPIILTIPTGNAGHIGANFLACKDIGGLPILKFVAPHNLNNYLVRMIEQKKTEVDVYDTINCLSNAMNVKKPNNIPRILYIFKNDIKKMRDIIFPVTVDDKKTADIINQVYQEKGYLLDVHSAVAMYGSFEFLKQNPKFKNIKIGTFLTAHPAKFPDKIKNIIGFYPPIPAKLKLRLDSEEKNLFSIEANNMDKLRDIVEQTF